MTHKELHNNIPVRKEHQDDAILVCSILAGEWRVCADGNASKMIDMLIKAIDSEPRMKDIMLLAIELSEFNKEFPPELN